MLNQSGVDFWINMKRLLIVIVWLLSIPSIAFSQRSAWTTERGQLSEMIMSDAERDSIEWLYVNGILGAEDIATIRSLPSLKKLSIGGCKINEIPDSAFYGMPNLEVIKLPRKAKIIGAVILKNCPKLRKVKFPSKPTIVSPSAYEGIDPQILNK